MLFFLAYFALVRASPLRSRNINTSDATRPAAPTAHSTNAAADIFEGKPSANATPAKRTSAETARSPQAKFTDDFFNVSQPRKLLCAFALAVDDYATIGLFALAFRDYLIVFGQSSVDDLSRRAVHGVETDLASLLYALCRHFLGVFPHRGLPPTPQDIPTNPTPRRANL